MEFKQPCKQCCQQNSFVLEKFFQWWLLWRVIVFDGIPEADNKLCTSVIL